MEIRNQRQYNQAISRYKLLSSNAGVGALITTNTGQHVLIADVGQWPFLQASARRINEILADSSIAPEDHYQRAKSEISKGIGIDLVDDARFIQFLRVEKGLSKLLCLAAIPQLTLNENYNTINKDGNPSLLRLKERGDKKEPKDFAVPATHFPKWFRNEKGVLRAYEEWKELWIKLKRPIDFFAPPRDPQHPLPYKMKVWQKGKVEEEEMFNILTQTNLVLICENGHLSDIPWPNFLRWKAEHAGGGSHKGNNLFTDIGPCCDNPLLKWSENTNRSEGYASIFLECLNCKMGNGPASSKVNLEGINNLEPFCPGHKPWEMLINENHRFSPYDTGCVSRSGGLSTMKVALVTGNNVYFANTFSSIFIPENLITGMSPELTRLLRICEQRFAAITDPNKSKEKWAERRIDEEFLQENRAQLPDFKEAVNQLRTAFISGVNAQRYEQNETLYDVYRKEEYDVLSRVKNYESSEGLVFSQAEIHPELSPYFQQIKKVEELKVTSVQLDFSRVSPSERIPGENGGVTTSGSKNIFSGDPSDIVVLPAVENYGEGIFFELNESRLSQWARANDTALTSRIAPLLPTPGAFNGLGHRMKVRRDQAKLLLIHTFSHIIMRELEFTCGYPTASLKERLYISPDTSGVLIYTSDGSEGSMGGLIWQVQKDRMRELVVKALQRASDCSSDPMCWEDEGQGLFNLNLSACFSCSLVSETACEERNVLLDRRMLVDGEFGFFKELLANNRPDFPL